MKSVDWNVEKILKSIFWILYDYPARKDDYIREVQATVPFKVPILFSDEY